MLTMWDIWQVGMEQFLAGGQYYALFLVSFLYLYLTKRKEHKEFAISMFAMSALIIFPISALLLVKYRTEFYSYESLLALLPMTLCIAYVVTQLDDIRVERGNKRLAGAVIIGCIVLCGEPWTGIVLGDVQNEEIVAVLEVLQESVQEEVLVWGPNEVVEQARQYDVTWKLLYGRDMWQPSVRAYTYDWYSEDKILMYEWMSLSEIPDFIKQEQKQLSEEEAIIMAKEKDVTHIVLRIEREGVFSILEDNDYEEIARTSNYVIFKMITTL